MQIAAHVVGCFPTTRWDLVVEVFRTLADYWRDGLCGEFPLTTKTSVKHPQEIMVPVLTGDESSVPGGRHQAVAVANEFH